MKSPDMNMVDIWLVFGTHRGGAELWSVVVDVGNMNDRHTFAC